MISQVPVVLVLLGACLAGVNGAIRNITCAIASNGDMVASVYTEGLVGFDVGVFGCNTTIEVAADGWTETECVIAENQNITAFSTNISTINAMSQVYNVAVSCSRVTGTTDVNAGLTVETPTATATIQSTLKPTVAAKITQDSVADSPWSATAETSAFIGQPLKLWVYILEAAFRNGASGFSIYVRSAEVSNDAGQTVDATVEGCSVFPGWSEVVIDEQGVHYFDFDAFFMVPHTGLADPQTFTANVVICIGATCNTTSCGARKRRDVSEISPALEEEVTIQQTLKIVPYEDYIVPGEVDVTVEEQQQPAEQPAGHAQECEVCMQKSVMYGVTSLLVILLLLSVAVSCFLFVRTRRSGKLIDYDREMKGSSNPGYHN